ncbi:Protein M60.4 b [Aphelenchoides avenae]|nr:Protein M60.4 b [Aphelenchus avenae]
MAFELNTRYVQSTRGIIKIAQIIIGFVITSLLCARWYHMNCFGEGRLGFASGLNSVVLIINIVLLVLNLLNTAVWKMEHIYSVICAILFAIACGLTIWYIIDHNYNAGWLVASAVFLGVEFFLFLWDVKILQGESPNWF